MDYKQKYEAALSVAKTYHDCNNGKSFTANVVGLTEAIFPELKESEDERIRKSIIDLVEKQMPKSENKKWMISWLEKQGEQKLLNNDKYQTVPVKILDRLYESEKELEQLKQGEQKPNFCHHEVDLSNCSEEYRKAYYDGWNNCNQQHAQLAAEQNPIDKVEPKFKVGDIVRHKNGDTVTITQIDTQHQIYYYKGWDGAATVHSDFNISEQDNWELVEQKPTDKVEPRFKVGDWIIGNTIYKVLCIIDDEYRLSLNIDNSIVCAKIKTIDKKFHLWTINDAKYGDILACDTSVLIVDHIGDFEGESTIYSWYFADSKKFYGMDTKDPDMWSIEGFHPATKEQRDLLFSKMKEAGYEWDVEKKELRKIEQESEINDNILLRFAFYQYDDDTLYLSSVFVEECNRKHGYGTKILKAAEEIAKTLGVSKIRLKAERNTWMEEWYKKNGYEYLSPDGEYDWLEKRVEQNPAWSEEDIRNLEDIDSILFYDSRLTEDVRTRFRKFLKFIKEGILPQPQPKQDWSEKDEKILCKCLDAASGYYSPEDKLTMKDWLRNLKGRIVPQPQPKQDWSEDDEEHANSLLERIKGLCRNEFATTRFAISEDEEWLKSLKEKVKGE